MAELTPMMQQYQRIKEENGDALLFFRLGDFYEMFGEDAKVASRELDLTLTTRDRGKDKADQTPMCGVPYHSCEGYIARLIAKGYKVAICEQMEDPATAKGLVDRDIVRVVTPGTVIDAACLEEGRSNYISGLSRENDAGSALPTFPRATPWPRLSGEERMPTSSTSWPLLPVGGGDERPAAENRALGTFCDRLTAAGSGGEASFEAAAAAIARQYGEDARRLPREQRRPWLWGAVAYLYDTQKTDLSYINDLDYYEQGQFMELDPTARRNLELTETLRGKEKRGSLLWVLDKTKTPMGSRCLRGFWSAPCSPPRPSPGGRRPWAPWWKTPWPGRS